MKKEEIKSSAAPAAAGPYSQAVRAGGLVFVSGQLPLDAETGEMADGIENQTAKCLENIRGILSAAGLSLDDLVKCTVFLTRMEDFPLINKVYASYFGNPCPARSCVEVSALPRGAAVEIEAIAVVKQHAE
ncbi:MAG: reactive intermediate/imine deaminase [Oscillospiraceae bacterium]|nr:reactive intermediate/imine deaminase [Oscillospiraceae bacterium]